MFQSAEANDVVVNGITGSWRCMELSSSLSNPAEFRKGGLETESIISTFH